MRKSQCKYTQACNSCVVSQLSAVSSFGVKYLGAVLPFIVEVLEGKMDVSELADATDNLIKSLALFIEIAHYCVVIYGVRKEWSEFVCDIVMV